MDLRLLSAATLKIMFIERSIETQIWCAFLSILRCPCPGFTKRRRRYRRLIQAWAVVIRRCRKALQSVEIPTVVAGIVDRSFEDERLTAQFRMAQNAAKPFESDVPLADTRVTVDVRAERRLRVVDVDDVDVR